MLRAILFDLDDTLFDHRQCARKALTAVYASHARFAETTFDAFERAHAEHLETLHVQVVKGEIQIDDARIERFRRLLAAAGGDEQAAARAAAAYRAAYVKARSPVPGARAVLERLHAHARIGVVSNNLLAEQREKLQQCGLTPYVDALVVSEEAGISKPDPAIFAIALARLRAGAGEAVMIGDSWAADVQGARAAGIHAIWFNPDGLPSPDPSLGVTELRVMEPADVAANAILESYRRAHRN
jgi:YjjG family noncanonical pyrimidine nucleotidase